MLGINQLELLNYHRFLLTRTADRLERYRQALDRVISPGDVVIDLGAGTGILGMLALGSGASRVYAIEETAALDLARTLAAANGVEHRFVFLDCRSTLASLPERADVLIADIGDLFVMEPGGVRAMVDARERMLKPSGKIIPESVEFFVAPVEARELYERTIDAWAQNICGVDLSALRPYAVNNYYQTAVPRDSLLADAASVTRIRFCENPQTLLLTGTADFTIARSGALHGVCGWFSTALAGGVVIDNSPRGGTTNYPQAYFPISKPVAVEAGDVIRVSLHSHDAMELRWSVGTSRGGETIACFEQSTWHGFPLYNDRLHTIVDA